MTGNRKVILAVPPQLTETKNPECQNPEKKIRKFKIRTMTKSGTSKSK